MAQRKIGRRGIRELNMNNSSEEKYFAIKGSEETCHETQASHGSKDVVFF